MYTTITSDKKKNHAKGNTITLVFLKSIFIYPKYVLQILTVKLVQQPTLLNYTNTFSTTKFFCICNLFIFHIFSDYKYPWKLNKSSTLISQPYAA